MRIALLGLMAITAISAVDMTPAEARDNAFCIKGQDYDTVLGDCSFSSYEQCQATASGRYAYCDVNPYYAGAESRPVRKRHHRQD
jgi:hypothetical protein